MPPITVDPNALSGAGKSISSVGDQIAAAVSALESGLAGGARSGLDPAGLAFGHTYQQVAQGLLDAGAAAVNGGRGIGFGVQMSATNYSRADAASTIGGGTSALTPPDKPAEFSSPAAPSALGGGVLRRHRWPLVPAGQPSRWGQRNRRKHRTRRHLHRGQSMLQRRAIAHPCRRRMPRPPIAHRCRRRMQRPQ